MPANFYIPMDVIHIILEKLAVRSLLRFKSVSKSWNALINSSVFIKSHLNHSVETNSITSSRLLFVPLKGFKVLDQFSLCGTGECLKLSLSYKFKLPLSLRQNRYKIIGSCHGLICLLFKPKRFVLCNVSTRLVRPVPINPTPNKNGVKGFKMYCFGYDSRGEDYKLVMFYRQKLSVYSLKTDSWKLIDKEILKYSYNFNSCYKSILVNNRLHWIGDGGYQILSYDLYDEELREVGLPKFDYKGVRKVTKLGILDGYLCANLCKKNGCLGIWMMREYNNVQSWVKPYSFSVSKTIPLRIFKEGCEFIFNQNYNSGFYVWNSQHEKNKITKIKRPRGVEVMHEAVEYIESLVPLMGHSYKLSTLPKTPRHLHLRKKRRLV